MHKPYWYISVIYVCVSVSLDVHTYTFRADPGRIPGYVDNFDGMLDVFYNQVKVDGVFTDFPDKAVDFLNR